MLIEAPVMLSVMKIVDRTRVWYGRKSGVLTYAECCPVPAASSGG
jgi:ACR3 family arsenite transporter